MSLWTWALAAYARPGVQAACLELQDHHGQNVCYLLWAVWARTADPALLRRGALMTRSWDSAVTGPLREARRALKPVRPGFADRGREALRDDVKTAELAAERALFEALEGLDGRRQEARPAEALRAALAAWGDGTVGEAAQELAAALDLDLLPRREGPHDGGEHHGPPGRMDDDDAEWEQGLRERLAVLTQEHADLDAAIQALALSPLPDIQIVGRLKRRKLALKDEIARIQDQLTPDIIA